MHAASLTQQGAPAVLQYGELPTPEPGPGQVLVRIAASAVNPIDTYIRSGALALPRPAPYIPGCDLAGTVTAVGPGVKEYKVGDRVWGSNQGLAGRQGTLAEFAAVDEHWLAPIPAGMTEAQAAAGALVGITAHLGLFLHVRLQPGQTVFVNGGTGGVGAAVVQLAKGAGARVVATVGSAEKQALCRSWGADCVVNYRDADLDDQIRRFTEPLGGIDVWWETQREPTFERTIGLMARRGTIVLMAGRQSRPTFPVGPFYVKDLRMCGFAMFNASPAEQRESALALNALFARGGWHPQIGATFPLREAAAAHQLQEDNTLGGKGTLTGKIVVLPE